MGELFQREAEAHQLQTAFQQHSNIKDLKNCEGLTGVTLTRFIRRFINQKLTNVDLPDEEKYNVNHWTFDFENDRIIEKPPINNEEENESETSQETPEENK